LGILVFPLHPSSTSLSIFKIPQSLQVVPPLLGFHKVNFDGTSKGNPGYDTNNSAEIWGLIKGVKMSLYQNLTQLIIEGESKIIIDLETKILNGRDPGKITPSWCLLGPLHSF
jgi:hypothetical protein